MSVQGVGAAKDAQHVAAWEDASFSKSKVQEITHEIADNTTRIITLKAEELSRSCDARIEQMDKAHTASCSKWEQEIAQCNASQDKLEAENALLSENVRMLQATLAGMMSFMPMQDMARAPPPAGPSMSLKLATLTAFSPAKTEGSTMPGSASTSAGTIQGSDRSDSVNLKYPSVPEFPFPEDHTNQSRPAPRAPPGLQAPPRMTDDVPAHLQSPKQTPRTPDWEFLSPLMMSPQPSLGKQVPDNDNFLLVSPGARRSVPSSVLGSPATLRLATPQRGGTPGRASTPLGLRTPGTPGTPKTHRTPRLSAQMKSPAVRSSPFVLHEGGGCTFGFMLRIADGLELGLDVTYHDGAGKALHVKGVKIGGAIEAWNKQCVGGPAAGKAVLPGDTITAINAATTASDMLAEVKRTKMLKITVTRLDPEDESAVAAPWAQPRAADGENMEPNRPGFGPDGGMFAAAAAAAAVAYAGQVPDDFLAPLPQRSPFQPLSAPPGLSLGGGVTPFEGLHASEPGAKLKSCIAVSSAGTF